ncbi:hypothetical protein SD457_09715 [Coprobacillaceae bacterium CR2/5/TPMF4]|nr:hypothetical protein SD457_09715 [Coprobacillaceae bacterium CR2/5/TPMF4]
MVVISISRLKNTIERMIKENESFLPATYRKKVDHYLLKNYINI